MRRRTPLKAIAGAMDRRRVREADINLRVYMCPNGPGEAKVRDLCNDEVKYVSAPGATFAPGSIVMTGAASSVGYAGAGAGESIISPPPPGRRGGARFIQVYPIAGIFDVVGITGASPSSLDQGTSNNAVTLSGFGFRQTPVDTVDAVVWSESSGDWIADSLITVHDVTWSSSTQLSIQIDVSASAPPGYPINLRVQRSAS